LKIEDLWNAICLIFTSFIKEAVARITSDLAPLAGRRVMIKPDFQFAEPADRG